MPGFKIDKEAPIFVEWTPRAGVEGIPGLPAEAAEKIAALGFGGIEIMAERPHLRPGGYGEAELARLAYRVRLSLELYPYAEAPEPAGLESLHFLRPLFQQAGLPIAA